MKKFLASLFGLALFSSASLAGSVNDGAIKLFDDDLSNYIVFDTPSNITSNRTCTLQDSAAPIPDSCVGNGVDDGGSPGGSDTQVQFNDGGSFGGDAGLTYDKADDVFSVVSGRAVITGGGLGSGESTLEVDSGTTVTFPDGWGNTLKLSAELYPALWFYTANTGHGLIYAWDGGPSGGQDQFWMERTVSGAVNANNRILWNFHDGGQAYYPATTNLWDLGKNNARWNQLFVKNLLAYSGTTVDIVNGTTAQSLNIYNTDDGAGNDEKLFAGWAASEAYVMTTKDGTGSIRPFHFGNNAGLWSINGSGHLFADSDNANDIGASGANRPRNGYFAGDVVVADEAYDSTNWNGSLEVPTKNAVRDKIEALSVSGTSPGGSDTQVQFNDGGSFGGDSGLTFNKTTNALVIDGAAGGSPALTMQTPDNFGWMQFTGTNAGQGGPGLSMFHNSASPAVGDVPGYWSVGGKTTGGDGLSVNLGSLQVLYYDVVDGSEDAVIGFQGAVNGNQTYFDWNVGSINDGQHGAFTSSDAYLGWNDDNSSNTSPAPDLKLWRDAADTLALKRSTNAQEQRIYNTDDGAGNGEFASLGWKNNSNVFTIQAEATGTGTARGMRLEGDGEAIVVGGGTIGDVEVQLGSNDWGAFVIEGDEASDAAPGFVLYHNSPSPAANDFVGYFEMWGKDDGGNLEQFAGFQGIARDVTNGSEDGTMSIFTLIAGSRVYSLNMDSQGTYVPSNSSFGWNNDTGPDSSPSVDTRLCRSAAGSVAVRTTDCSTRGVLDVGTIELGAASDTTLARSSAGNVTIEGNAIYRAGGTDVAIADGGTGASDAATAFGNLKQDATTSATGVVELATDTEVKTGTDTTRYVTPSQLQYANQDMCFKISDEATALTTGTAKLTFYFPAAWTVTGVYAGLSAVSTSGNPAFDINEAGVSILSTTLTIDANENTSGTAATAAVISDSSIAANAKMTVDIDTAGTGAKGAQICISGHRS